MRSNGARRSCTCAPPTAASSTSNRPRRRPRRSASGAVRRLSRPRATRDQDRLADAIVAAANEAFAGGQRLEAIEMLRRYDPVERKHRRSAAAADHRTPAADRRGASRRQGEGRGTPQERPVRCSRAAGCRRPGRARATRCSSTPLTRKRSRSKRASARPSTTRRHATSRVNRNEARRAQEARSPRDRTRQRPDALAQGHRALHGLGRCRQRGDRAEACRRVLRSWCGIRRPPHARARAAPRMRNCARTGSRTRRSSRRGASSRRPRRRGRTAGAVLASASPGHGRARANCRI